MDLLLPVAGGDGIKQSIAAIRAADRIAQVGFLPGQTRQLRRMPLVFRQTTIQDIAVATRTSFSRMKAFLNQHDIRPVIDTVYPFEETPRTYEHLAKGAVGKIVIKAG
ncbi:alcohol dehydrogenase [Stutzerimonas stutzeri TS44]|nr:alcohol dehydrogenase [Stutzerimonas stutzeri TS44]